MNITDRTVIDAINERLHREYRVLDGRPIYRVVWSADQLEMRRGWIKEFYGHIFIREYFGVQEVKKYWYFKHPCWTLEKLIFAANEEALKSMIEEFVESRNGIYEPVFTFIDKDSKPLPVPMELVEAILDTLHNPRKRFASDFAEDERKVEMAEEAFFYDELSRDARSDLFVYDLGMWVSSNQKKYRESMTHIEPTKPIEIAQPNEVPNAGISAA